MASDIRSRLRADAIKVINGSLDRRTHSPRSIREARRELVWWADTRFAAARARTPQIARASGLAFSPNGYVELVPIEVPAAGPGQVTVLAEASALNVGTERAQYLRLPNAKQSDSTRPSGSLAGTVQRVGRGVTDVREGDRVTVISAPHASLVTARAEAVIPISPTTPFVDASLTRHAVIAAQGVRLAGLAESQRFAVVGLGIIGALTMRLASATNGAAPIAVAASRAKEALAVSSGADRLLVADADAEEIAALDVPVVFEVTGDPSALRTAVAMAARGGTVVLLGSSRGVSRDVPVGEIRRKGLTLVGAHVDTVRMASGGDGAAAERALAEEFLALLADGAVRVDDLVSRVVDPPDAPTLYRAIVDDHALVGAAIDWSRLPREQRAGRSHLLRPPDLTGRGADFDGPTLPSAARRAPRPVVEDPFAGATGNLRIGLLGCGDISVANAAAIAAAPNARLVACFDPVSELARDIADAHGCVTTASAEALVARADVDAVFVATPHHLHEPMALSAITAGKHVIVEKPLSNDVESARRMLEAARSAGVTLTTCFPQRYDAPVRMARHLVEQGAIGELGGSSVRVLMDKSPAYWSGGYSGRSQSTWRASRAKAGGGVLIMNACHYVDIVRHLAGVEVATVTALAGNVDDQKDVEDSIALALRYRNGAIGSVVASSAVRGTTFNEVQIWGSEGHIVLEPGGRFYTLRHIDGFRTARWHDLAGVPPVNSRAAFVSRLASAIDQGIPADIGPEEGLWVQRMIEAAYDSSDGNVPVELEASGPDARRDLEASRS